MAEWAGRWLGETSGRSDRTTRHHEERTRAFVRDFGDRPLVDLERGELVEWLRREGHGSRESSVKALLNAAVDAGALAASPLHRVTVGIRSRDRGEANALTAEELDHLVGKAASVLGPYGKVVFGPMIRVAAWSGLAQGELYALAPEDILWDEDAIDVCCVLGPGAERVPAPRARKVALLPPARDALLELGVRDLPEGMPIFLTSRARPLTERTMGYYWPQVRDAFVAQLPEGHWAREGSLAFSTLQHFFGMRLAERGVSPQDIAEMMGDSDGGAAAAARYTQPARRDARRRVLDAFSPAA